MEAGDLHRPAADLGVHGRCVPRRQQIALRGGGGEQPQIARLEARLLQRAAHRERAHLRIGVRHCLVGRHGVVSALDAVPPERLLAEQAVAPGDAALFEALREWRRDRASEQQLPPYVIFHDATLSAIARDRPATREALGRISGIGQSKLERYGTDVLRIVRSAT